MTFSRTIRKAAGTIAACAALCFAPAILPATPPSLINRPQIIDPYSQQYQGGWSKVLRLGPANAPAGQPASQSITPTASDPSLSELANDARFMATEGTLDDLLATKGAAIPLTGKPDTLPEYLAGKIALLPSYVPDEHGSNPEWATVIKRLASQKDIVYVYDSGSPDEWNLCDQYINRAISKDAIPSSYKEIDSDLALLDALRSGRHSRHTTGIEDSEKMSTTHESKESIVEQGLRRTAQELIRMARPNTIVIYQIGTIADAIPFSAALRSLSTTTPFVALYQLDGSTPVQTPQSDGGPLTPRDRLSREPSFPLLYLSRNGAWAQSR